MNLVKAHEPTFYFIGVTTSQSSIMKLFPLWAKALNLNAVIKGIDIELNADPEVYREVVSFIKQDELSLGALVTTHKINVYKAAADLFDELDESARLFGELSCISKRGGKLVGHAKDPLTSRLAMEAFIPAGFWSEHRGEALILGAGGSGIAIASNLVHDSKGSDRPSKVYVVDRDEKRLLEMKTVIENVSTSVPVDYTVVTKTEQSDRILGSLKPYSAVINATGLGKDRPGSPLTDNAVFPSHSVVWELNYRGDLLFMHQALKQKDKANLHVADGWMYFIHGWTQVIAEVFHLEIDSGTFAKLEQIASDFR
ncbi:hypothetical protein PACILC2_06490 [Paenibacillus cisolokensis]|uniref:Shikimate dehydrogenase n=1 Tax=Paenibacillus cisolokensis TaxID=1658519 RepID=A0ABQ4N1M5_9BACL|nr:shikimate dehydrogenase [Paenibacillus cisolokensis]GIQ62081.1 hypothetical protein PACILC2_06490 [Paenibacillus cisolokensis]